MRAALAALLLLPASALASDFPSLGSVTQPQLRGLAQDLGAAFSYKGVTPATSLGLLGFDLGVEVSRTSVENASAFRAAGAGSPSDVVVPRLHLYKGLPGGLDVGAFVGASSEVSATLWGADVRYAFVRDGLAAPAVALRASYTKATGTGALDVDTAGLDLMVSKQFALATPYAGAGAVRVRASAAGTALAAESFNRGRWFGGLNVNLVAVNLAIEAEKMGDNTSLSAKLGWRF